MFTALDLDDRIEFPSITERERLVRSRCGNRAVNILPDWRKHNANGIEKAAD